MRFRWLRLGDRADSSMVGTILMVGVVVAAVPGMIAIQSGIRENYDQGAEAAQVATQEAKAGVPEDPADDPDIAAATEAISNFTLQAAQARAAAEDAKTKAESYDDDISEAKSRAAETTVEVDCGEKYVKGEKLPQQCPAEPEPWEEYMGWKNSGAWTCKSYGIPGQQRCYPST